jgi:hypothetical protein
LAVATPSLIAPSMATATDREVATKALGLVNIGAQTLYL